jgi:hypothetical protein
VVYYRNVRVSLGVQVSYLHDNMVGGVVYYWSGRLRHLVLTGCLTCIMLLPFLGVLYKNS